MIRVISSKTLSARARFGAILARPAFQALFAGLAALLLYLHSLHGSFILDDWTYLVNNPFIKDTGFLQHLGNLKQYAASQGMSIENKDVIYNVALRPLAYLTFAGNYRLHGLEIAGYKITNILCHAVATVLVYLFTYQLGEQTRQRTKELEASSPIPILTALLFASHPVQTQAVSYIIQRFTSLVACFYLIALVAYCAGRRSTARTPAMLWYLLAIVAAIAGMLTKENAFTLPLMIVTVELLFFRGSAQQRVLLLAPFLATMVIIPLRVMALSDHSGGVDSYIHLVDYDKIPHSSYLFTELRVIVTYLRLLLFPVNQQLDYDYPVYHSLLEPPVLLSLIALLSLALLAMAALYLGQQKKRSWMVLTGFGVIWFLMTLSIESGLVPLDDVIFEHRLYLPSVGIFIALAAAGTAGLKSLNQKPRWQTAVVILTLALFLSFSVATVKRHALWSDALGFWRDNAAKTPHKTRVLRCLGETYLAYGRPQDAVETLTKINLGKIRDGNILVSLGEALMASGDFDNGVRIYAQAIYLAPNNALAFHNLGMHYAMRKDFVKALECFANAVRIDRFDLMARRSRAEIFLQLDNKMGAVKEYEGILALWPNDTQALQMIEKYR